MGDILVFSEVLMVLKRNFDFDFASSSDDERIGRFE